MNTYLVKVWAGLWAALLIGLLGIPMAAVAASGYYTQAGKIYNSGGQEIQLRGVSHFGFNADILLPMYLWEMGWKEQIAQIKSLGFNAVRLPFVPDTLYVTTPVDQLSYVEPSKNPELLGKTPLQVMDLWMAEADRQGLYILLDFHSVSKAVQYPTWFLDDPADFGLTYNNQAYTALHWQRDLALVAQRYAHLPHFLAIDIYNEPHGAVRWSTGDPNSSNPKHFWKAAAESASAAVLQANPNLLIFVQGINGNYDGIENSNIPMNWGEDLQPQAYQPLNIPADKLVFTPHTYGPDVFVKSSFSAPNYPANLAADWETLFGQFSSQHAVVLGEWGGRYGQGGTGQADVDWQNALVDYLLSKNMRSNFYWCYTPNSGDSGGILDDNLNVRQDKMALLQRLWGGAPSVTTPGSAPASSSTSVTGYTVGGSLAPALLLLLASALAWRLVLQSRLQRCHYARVARRRTSSGKPQSGPRLRLAGRQKIALGGWAVALWISLTSPLATAAVAGYYTQGGKIYDSTSQEIQIRGVSHFGFNADILLPQYLWQMGWKEQIAQIKSLGFNAVRLPFVPDTLYVTTKVDQLSYVEPNKNPELIGKTPLQALDLWMAEADRQGLYVMLDFHSVSKVRQYQTWFIDNSADFGLIYNQQAYTADHWKRDLAFVAVRYAHLPRFFAIDIFNEPQNITRWSTGDPNTSNPKYFWKPAAEGAAAAVLQANPKLLIFVQGVNANFDGIEQPNIPINWGENFQPQAYQPLNIPNDKLVLSPHTYGPDVYYKPTFNASNYPANLAADWETLFGQFSTRYAVVLGEWGGRYGQGGTGQADVAWQNALVDYLQSKNIRSSFYWCYSPNSGDTGGILDDNLNVRQDKMALLERHWGGAPAVASTTLAWTSAGYSVAQSAGYLKVSVKRTGGSSGAVSVQYATADGTARAGADYTSTAGILSWASGDTAAKAFRVPVSNATSFAGSKRFNIKLSNAGGGAALGSPHSVTATIYGNTVVAGAGTLALSAPAYTVAQNGGSVTIKVNRTGGSAGAVLVRFATADGTAKSGSDYTVRSGTISWAAGSSATKSVTIAISNATPFTGSRNFSLRLSNAAGGAALGTPSSASVTINGSK